MKKKQTAKRWLALFLSLCMIMCTGVMTSDYGLRASNTDSVTEESAEQAQKDAKAAKQESADTAKVNGSEKKENVEQKEVTLPKENGDGTSDAAKSDDTSDLAKSDAADAEMPAQSFTETASNGVTVNAKVKEGVFPAGTKMKVKAIGNASAEKSAKKVVDQLEDAIAVDITFMSNGKEVQPAEGKSVSVEFELGSKLGGKQFSVLHKDDDGTVTEVKSADANAEGATFKADSFSVYIITGEAPTFTTYKFHDAEGSVYDEQKVKSGDNLNKPETPSKAHNKFMGWATSENASEPDFYSFGEVSNNTAGTVDLYPVFQEVYYIYFMDAQGRVAVTKEGAKGAEIDTTDIDVPLEDPGDTVTAWNTQKDLKGESYAVGSTITIGEDNIKLYPEIGHGHFLYFDTQGGSYMEPQFVKGGEKTHEPTEVPTYPGYTFDGWHWHEDGKTGLSKYPFGFELTKDRTVYAEWKANKSSSYKVIYWKQSANDNINTAEDDKTYDYGFSVTDRTAETGATVSPTSEDQSMSTSKPEEFKGFVYNANKSVSVKVKGDGSTVLNVYYDRQKLKINFWKMRSETYTETDRWGWSRQTSGNTDYIYDTYEGLYGTTLKANGYEWPDPGDGNRWGSYYTRKNATSIPTLMFIDAFDFSDKADYKPTSDMDLSNLSTSDKAGHGADNFNSLSEEERQNELDVSLCSMGSAKQTFEHYKQNLDGKTYPDTPTNSNKSNSTKFSVTDKYIGFKVAQYSIDGGAPQDTRAGATIENLKNKTLRIYHARNKYNLEFSSNGRTVHTEKVYYEAPMSNFASYIPPRPSGINEKYTFQGWFKDTEFTEPFDFDVNMPANNLVAYAKWEKPVLHGTIHEKMDGSGATWKLPTKYGETVDKADLPTVTQDGNVISSGSSTTISIPLQNKWVGWATKDENGNFVTWDYNIEVTSDTELYPYYVSTQKYEIQYDVNGSTADVTEVEKFIEGTSVKLLDNVTAPTGKVFLYWTDKAGNKYYPGDKAIITPALADDVDETPTITFTAVYGDKTKTTTLTYKAGNYEEGKPAAGEDVKVEANGSTDLTNNTELKVLTQEESQFADSDDYYFTGWTNGKTAIAPGSDIGVDNLSENTLTAVWAKKTAITVKPIDKTKTYDGTALEAENTAEISNGKLKAGDSVVISGVDASLTNAGTKAIQLDKNNIQVMRGDEDVTREYKITAANGTLTVDRATATVTPDNVSKKVDEADNLTAQVSGTINGDTIDYTLTRESGEKVGSYKITATGDAVQGNYNVTFGTATLKIEENGSLQLTTSNDYEGPYTATEHAVSASTETEGATISYQVNGGEWTTEAPSFKNAGDYTVKIKAEKEGYTTKEETVTVKITKVKVTVTPNSASKVYGTADPELTATVEGTVNNETVDYNLSRGDGQDVGKYDIVASEKAAQTNYEVEYKTAKDGFVITPATATVTADRKSKTYGEDDPEFTATVTGLVGNDKVEYTVSCENDGTAGKHTITVEGNATQGNYNVVFQNGIFTIKPASNMTATATGHAGAYDGKTYKPVVEPSVTEGTTVYYRTSDDEEWTTTAPEVKDYTETPVNVQIRVSNPNYEDVYDTVTLNVQRAAVTVTPQNESITYGETPSLTPVITGLVGDDTIDYTVGEVGTEPGTYPICVSGEATQGNYTVTYGEPATLTISKKGDVLAITANGGSKIYDGKELAAEVSANGADDIQVTYRTKASEDGEYGAWTEDVPRLTNVGKIWYEAKAESSRYADVTGEATLEVTPKAITITADDKTKEYSAEDPAFTYTAADMVKGETADFQVGFTRVDGNEVGEYAITPSGAAQQGNYSITYVPGTLSITPKTRAMTVTGTDYTGIYDGEEHGSAATSNVASGTTISYSVDNGESWSTDVPTIKDAGTKTVLVKAENPNYATAENHYTLTVNRKAVTVNPSADNAKSKVYGEADPEFKATVDGTLGTDTINYSIRRDGGENVGDYTVSTSGDTEQGNYSVTYGTADFAITSKAVTVKANDKTKVYGAAEPTYDATVDGLVGDDTISYGFTRESGDNVGTYTITPNGETTQGNYTVTYETGSLSITESATMTVTAEAPASRPYNGETMTAGYKSNVENVIVRYNVADENGNFSDDNWQAEAPTLTDAGSLTYKVKVENGNYVTAVSEPVTMTITKAAVTVTANSKTKAFGENDPEFNATVTGTVGNDTVNYSFERDPGDAVGSYPIRVKGEAEQGNYVVTYVAGTLTISTSEDAQAITPVNIAGHVYDGTTITAGASSSAGDGTTFEYQIKGSDEWTSEAPSLTNVGKIEYLVRAHNSNYEDATTTEYACIEVVARPVTINIDNKSKAYQGTDPELTAEVSGDLDNDKVTYELSRAAGEAAGEYTITAEITHSNDNYEVTVNNGTFTITKGDGSLINLMDIPGTEDGTYVYNGNAQGPIITATAPDGTPVTIEYSTDGGETWTSQAPTVTNVGDTKNVQVRGTNPNYEPATGSYQLAVSPKPITVTADNKEQVYGDTAKELTLTADGLVGNDTIDSTLDVSVARESGNDAGTYAITPSGDAVQGNYSITYVSGNYVITKRTVTVTADSKSKTYGQADPTLTATVTGTVNNETVSYEVKRVAGETAADYVINVTGANDQGNYSVDFVGGTFTINKAAASSMGMTLPAESPVEFEYNGQAQGVTVATSQVKGETFLVEYSTDGETWSQVPPTVTNVAEGTVNVQVRATNPNYETATGEYSMKVTPKAVTVAADDKTQIYGQGEVALTATVTGTIEGETVDYNLSRADGDNVGTYPITVSGAKDQGNYTVTFVNGASYTIAKSDDQSAFNVTATGGTQTYSGNAITGTASASIGDGTTIEYSVKGDDGYGEWTTEAPSRTDVGTTTFKARALNDNYKTVESEEASLVVTPKAVTVTAVAAGKTYGDTDPTLTANVEGLIGEDTVEYDVTRAPGEDVNEYTITPAGEATQGNYSVTYNTATFTITKADGSALGLEKYAGYDATYDGQAHGDAVGTNVTEETTIQYSLDNGATWQSEAPQITNVGEMNVTVKASNPNYEDATTTYTLKVTPKEAFITLNDASKTYGEADPEFSVKAVNGEVTRGDLEYTISRAEGKDAGSYAITANVSEEGVSANYHVTVNDGTLTIAPKAVTVTAKDAEKTYSDPATADPELTASVEGTLPGESVEYRLERVSGEAAGTYDINVIASEDQGNYIVTGQKGTFTIHQKAGELALNDPESKGGEYNGQPQGTAARPTVTEGTTVTYSTDGGETWTETAPTLTDVGELTVQVKAENPNYVDVTGTYTLKVTPKAVTVKADNAGKVYQAEEPETFAVTITGRVSESDTIEYTVSREAGEAAGNYTITPSGEATQGNYTVSYETGIFTISKKGGEQGMIVNNPTDMGGVYDGTEHGSEVRPAVTEGTTVKYSTDGGETWTENAPTRTNAGSDHVIAVVSNPNYDDVTYEYDLTITQKPVTVTADNAGKTYGDAEPKEFTATTDGTLNGDKVTYTVSRESGEDAGDYVITPSGKASQGNYSVDFVPGTFTINPATADAFSSLIDVPDQTSTEYDATEHKYPVTVSDKVDGETKVEYSTDGGKTWSTEVPGATDVADSTTVQVRVTNDNYEPFEPSYKLEITPKTVTVTAKDAGKKFGATEPTLEVEIKGNLNNDQILASASRASGESVGSYDITVSADENQGNYKVVTQKGTFTISPADASGIELQLPENNDASFTYNGQPQGTSVTATATGVDNVKVEYSTDGGKTWTETAPTITNVKDGPVTVDVRASNPNYETATAQYTLEVTPKEVTVKADSKTQIYGEDAEELTATVTGTIGNDTVKYELNREPGDNVGTYPITVTGKQDQGNYTVTFESDANYTITKSADQDAFKVTATGGKQTYNGKAITGSASATVSNGTTIEYKVEGGEWTSQAPSRTEVGSTTFKVRALNDNYETVESAEATLTVTAAPVTVTAVAANKVFGAADPELKATVSGLVNDESTDLIKYVVSRAAGEAAGEYAITASGAEEQGNYKVTYVGAKFTISKASADTLGSAVTTPETTSYEYDAEEHEFPVTVDDSIEGETKIEYSTDGGQTWSETVPTATDVADSTEVTVKVTNPNYEPYETTYPIAITPKAVTVTAQDADKVFGEADPELTAEADGTLNGDQVRFTVTREAGEDAGTYRITVNTTEDQGNYKVEGTNGTFTINKASKDTLGDAVNTPTNPTAEYDGQPHDFPVTVDDTVSGDTKIEYSTDGGQTWSEVPPSATDVADSTEVTVRVTNDNYEPYETSYPLTITPKAVTVTADPKTQIYGEAPENLTATVVGTIGNDTVKYDLSRSPGEDVGTYPITVTGDQDQGNYTVTFSSDANYTITASADTDAFKVTAKGGEQTYNGQAITGSATATVSNGTTIEYSTDGGQTWTTEAPSRTKVGTTTFKARALNYNYITVVSEETSLVVTPMEVTVTANADSKTFGEKDPEFTASVSELAKGEDASKLIQYTVSREAGENAGQYDITPAGDEEQGNYKVTYVSAKFTINKASKDTLGDAVNKPETTEHEYDGESHDFPATVDDTVKGDTKIEYSTDGGQTWSENPPTATDVADSTEVTVRVTNDNYEPYETTYPIAITPKAVTVTAKDAGKKYGETDPTTFDAEVEGTLNNDKINYSASRVAGENVGPYDINVTAAAEQGNYTVSTEKGTFTISKASKGFDISVPSVTEGTYDGTPQGGNSEATTNKPGDDTKIQYSTDGGQTWQDEPPTRTDAGDTEVIAKATNPNYEDVTVECTLHINQREVTVKALNVSKTYQDPDPDPFEVSVKNVLDGDKDKITYTVSREPGEDVKDGGYTITPSGEKSQGNYSVSYETGTLTITKKGGSNGLVVNDPEDTGGDYDGTEHGGPVQPNVTEGTKVQYSTDGGETWSDEYPTSTDACDIHVTAKVTNPNYDDVTYEYDLKINRLNVTITADNSSKTYGESDPAAYTAKVSGTLAGEESKIRYSVDRTAGEAAGAYPINVTAESVQGNYNVKTVAGNFQINKASAGALGDKVTTPETPTAEYDGTEHSFPVEIADDIKDDPNTKVEYSTDGGQTWSENPPSATDVKDSTDVTVKVTNPNYDDYETSYEVTITPKPVTVTAKDASKKYGQDDPKLDAEVQGTLNGDTVDYKVSRESGEKAGAYDINVTADENQGNYKVTGAKGTFTIEKASADELGDKVTNPEKPTAEYDGEPHSYPVDIADDIADDPETKVEYSTDGGQTWSENPPSATDVDDSTEVTVKVTNPNYDPYETSYDLTVTPKEVTLTSGSSEREYNRKALTNDEVTAEGFIGNDGASYKVTGSQTEVGESQNTFSYELNEGVKESNYSIKMVNGTLKVTKAHYYTLTIHYVDQKGKTVKKDFTKQYLPGDAAKINSPAIDGYTVEQAFVQIASMPNKDVTVTVTYTKKAKADDHGDGGNGGNGGGAAANGGTGNAAPPAEGIIVDADENGDPIVAPGSDVDTAKGLPETLTKDNAAPFLLMVIAMLLMMGYSRKMKLTQAEIFALEEEIERRRS